jgi:hypothetical protein
MINQILNLLVAFICHVVTDAFFILTAILAWHLCSLWRDFFAMPANRKYTLGCIAINGAACLVGGGLFYFCRYVAKF